MFFPDRVEARGTDDGAFFDIEDVRRGSSAAKRGHRQARLGVFRSAIGRRRRLPIHSVGTSFDLLKSTFGRSQRTSQPWISAPQMNQVFDGGQSCAKNQNDVDPD
jgi:hypothetical protein